MLMNLLELFCWILKMKTDYLLTQKANPCNLLMIFNLKLSNYIYLWRNSTRNSTRELMDEIIALFFFFSFGAVYFISITTVIIKTYLWSACYHIWGMRGSEGQRNLPKVRQLQTSVSLSWRLLLLALFTIAYGCIASSRYES